jgi:Pyruvate/2-oxoacid:ferredoxin oxidoreductase delta subunit
LTVCDGIVAMEGDGPGSSGTLRPMNLVIASPDALALDNALAKIMGVSLDLIPTLKEARRRGLVPADAEGIDCVGESVEAFAAKDFVLPKTSILLRLPRWSLFAVKILLRMKPDIARERCLSCGACLCICPVQAMSQKNGRMSIDHKKCILCFCCQEVCPHKAIVIKKNIFLRILSRYQS